MNALNTLLVCVFCSVFLPTLAAQKGGVKGIVTDQSGNVLSAVHVHLHTLEKGTYSNQGGTFQLKALPAGEHELHFSRLGYRDIDTMVRVEEGGITELSMVLETGSVQLSTISVTGSPTKVDHLATTNEVDILAGDDMRKVQRAGLGSSIEQISGVNSINTGTQFGKPVIRGLSGQRIRILLQGVPMDYQQYGVRHIPNIDPFLVERIEVVQGPNSVLYGSDALGGAINVFPIKPPRGHSDEKQLYGKVTNSYASNSNQYTGGLSLEGSNGKLGFAGSLIYRSAGNFKTPDARIFSDPDGEEGDPKFSGTLDHTDYEQLNGTFTTEYRDSFGTIGLNYTGWSNEHNFLLPNGKGLGQQLKNNSLQLYGSIPLNDHLMLKPKFTFLSNLRQSNKAGMTREALPDEGERAHLDILRNAYSVRIDLANRKWGRFSGRTGVDVRFTDQKSRGIGEPLVPSGNILEGGIYMYQQLDFDQLNINVGGRMDLRNQDAEPNTALNLPDTNETKDVLEQSYFTWSGSFGANYRLNERFSVSTNLSRGFRAAGFFDLHVDGLHGGIAAYQRGNPFLNPEISWNTDLSLKYRSDRLQFKATGYRNLIDDYIFLINTGEFSDQGPPVLRNIQTKALLYGGHMEVNAELIPGWKISLYGELVRGENRDDDLENVDELPLLPSDEIGGKLEWNQEEIGLFHSIYASVKVSYNFSKEAAGRYEPFWQFGSNFPFGVASTDPYTLIQLKAGLEFPFYERKIALDLWVDNLFDVSYRNFLDTYKGYALSPGRNIGLKLEIPFLSIHKPKKEE